jgi:hypothetical protein
VRRGGSGIALALARRIIEEHGGSIAIDSDAARGTTVRIALPGSTAERTPPRARRATSHPIERVVADKGAPSGQGAPTGHGA